MSENISPDVFSRGSLKLTFDLIRKSEPQLALTIRNITGGEPLSKEQDQVDNQNADFFKVQLDSFEVRSVVEALMLHIQETKESNNPGRSIVAKALTEDWMALAHKMISELPGADKPIAADD